MLDPLVDLCFALPYWGGFSHDLIGRLFWFCDPRAGLYKPGPGTVLVVDNFRDFTQVLSDSCIILIKLNSSNLASREGWISGRKH